jgi:hypothetical protein
MGSILISLLPYIIGSALVPLQIMIALLLLKSPDRGLLKASAYVAGMTTTRLLQGAVFSFVFAEAALPESGKRPVVSTLLLVLGILLLTTAYKKLQGGDDPDAPPPKWLMLLDQATPLKALGIGLGLPLVAAKLWVFTLSALATISAAQLGQPSSTIAFFLFILFAESLLILPIIFRIVMPVRSKTTLAQFSAWLNQNNRAIVIVVSFVFGGWFLYSGIDGLIQ